MHVVMRYLYTLRIGLVKPLPGHRHYVLRMYNTYTQHVYMYICAYIHTYIHVFPVWTKFHQTLAQGLHKYNIACMGFLSVDRITSLGFFTGFQGYTRT